MALRPEVAKYYPDIHTAALAASVNLSESKSMSAYMAYICEALDLPMMSGNVVTLAIDLETQIKQMNNA